MPLGQLVGIGPAPADPAVAQVMRGRALAVRLVGSDQITEHPGGSDQVHDVPIEPVALVAHALQGRLGGVLTRGIDTREQVDDSPAGQAGRDRPPDEDDALVGRRRQSHVIKLPRSLPMAGAAPNRRPNRPDDDVADRSQ
ncbi:hypothetical protein ACQEVC_24505 [Plantactinospora sp. CA-294935]|uniref:hypothetical protein n=1 Tax=Plantactinospora sp. CA-294935 TaxID=3240012 RepID=UPI003D91782F